MVTTMKFKTIVASAALIACAVWAQGSAAGVVLSDNFNADAQTLNWAGDSSFASLPDPSIAGQSSTDLIGTGFYDFYPGNGNYVDLDGSSGTGNNPAGVLKSKTSFGAGTYTLSFDLAGNARGAANQTTIVTLGGTTVASLNLSSSDPFTLHTFTFTTTGGNLMFLEQGPSDQQGNILDNVTLTSVPEPTTWALMLIGFGGLGAVMRVARRKLIQG